MRLLNARLRLAHFVRQAWRFVEPMTPYVDGRHIHSICDHLEAVAIGQIDNLLINIPPRFMKSLLVAAFFPAWVWGPHGDPGARFLYASYRERLAMRDSLRTRRIVESEWYRRKWPRVQLQLDQNEKMRFDNTLGGYRIASSVSGGNTGEGGDYVIADDPHNAREIWSELKRENVVEWWDDVMSSRTGRWPTNRKIVVMQRLHEGDLSGHILAEKGNYVHLFFPQEYDPELRPGRAGLPARSLPSPLGNPEWRSKPGTLLWPERFPRKVIDNIKRHEMTPYAYGGQHQQVPAPVEGGIFKREWIRYWEPEDEDYGPVMVRFADGTRRAVLPRKFPAQVRRFVQAWDFTFKGQHQARSGAEVDRVAGHVYAETPADAFLCDRIYQPMDFPATLLAIRDMTGTWPEAGAKYYEDAANGPAIAATLRGEIQGMIPVPADGDLLSRAHAIAWLLHAGHFYVPHPVMCPWVLDFIEFLTSFPNASHDDDVAALVIGLRRLFPVPRTLPEAVARRAAQEYPVFQRQ